MAAIANYPVNWNGGADDALGIGAIWDMGGQTFVVPSDGNYTTTSVDLPLMGVNASYPGGLTTVEIYAVDVNGFPTGDVISTGSVDLTGTPNGNPPKTISAIDYNIALSAGVLIASTTYVLVVYPPAGSFGVNWFGTTATGYNSGKPIHHVDGGSWGNSSALGDCAFRLFGDAITSPPYKPTNPTPANGATTQRLNLASFIWEAGTS